MQKFVSSMKSQADNSESVMEAGDHFKNGARPKSHSEGRNFLFKKVFAFLFIAFITASYAHAQYGYGRGYGGGGDLEEILGTIGSIIGIVIAVIIVRTVYRRITRNRKNTSSVSQAFMAPQFMGMRGKTKEQKKIVKFFMSTGLLGMIFRISNATFDRLLNSKADELVSGISKRALETHGMDEEEVREIPPILIEDFYGGSQYYKMFRDNTFRASEYQMTYLMFSDKQMYAYSYIFDLTSADTTEQTKEYFYEDITSVEVTKKQIEFPAPRPMEYILGGVAGIIIGLLLMVVAVSVENGVVMFFGFLILVAGVVLAAFLGYSRRVVEKLILRLTVPEDEFICAMNPNNITAIQGMKAKIREKKQ